MHICLQLVHCHLAFELTVLLQPAVQKVRVLSANEIPDDGRISMHTCLQLPDAFQRKELMHCHLELNVLLDPAAQTIRALLANEIPDDRRISMRMYLQLPDASQQKELVH